MDPKQSRTLMWSGCVVLLCAVVAFWAGLAAAIIGHQNGTDWLLYAGIAIIAISILVAMAGSAINMFGFVQQWADRWRDR
jgi:hypothetical protein